MGEGPLNLIRGPRVGSSPFDTLESHILNRVAQEDLCTMTEFDSHLGTVLGYARRAGEAPQSGRGRRDEEMSTGVQDG